METTQNDALPFSDLSRDFYLIHGNPYCLILIPYLYLNSQEHHPEIF